MAEINDVMLKVAELSVTDNSSSVRLQCRQVGIKFSCIHAYLFVL